MTKQPCSWWPASGETRASKRHDKGPLGVEQVVGPYDEESCRVVSFPCGSRDKREPSPGRTGEGQGRCEELGSAALKNPLAYGERNDYTVHPAATDFENLVMPTGAAGRRVPGLRFGDPRVMALFGTLSDFRFVFGGFHAKQLRPLVEHHLAQPYNIRQTAYDLRRLVRKGLLQRLPHCNRHQLTALGRRLVLFSTKLHGRVFCRGLGRLQPDYPQGPLNTAWHRFQSQLDALIAQAQITA